MEYRCVVSNISPCEMDDLCCYHCPYVFLIGQKCRHKDADDPKICSRIMKGETPSRLYCIINRIAESLARKPADSEVNDIGARSARAL